MNIAIVYESEFGATREIAAAIGEGMALSGHHSVAVHNVHELGHGQWSPNRVELLLVGAPTHAHSLPRPSTRAEGAKWPERPGSSYVLEPDAQKPGVREWLDTTRLDGIHGIAFGTRASMPKIVSGSSATAISHALRRSGAIHEAPEQDFLVDGEGALLAGELERARAWGEELAISSSSAAASR